MKGFLSYHLITSLFLIHSIYEYDDFSIRNLKTNDVIFEIESKLHLAEEQYNLNPLIAINLAKEAFKLSQIENSKEWLAESSYLLAKYYNKTENYDSSFFYLINALDLYTATKNEYRRIKVIQAIGDNYRFTTEYELALKYYNQTVNYARLKNDSILLIEGLLSCSSSYGNMYKIDSALLITLEANEIAKKINDIDLIIKSTFFLGDIYLFSGQPQKALIYFNLILKDFSIDEIKPSTLTGIYNSLAYAYLSLGKIELAQNYNKKNNELLKNYYRLSSQLNYQYTSFKIDSTIGKYFEAMQHFMKFKILNDSLIEIPFKKQLANYEVAYNLKQKEAHIEKLALENELKTIKIHDERMIIGGTFIIIILMVIFISLLFFSKKRLETRNNELIKAQDIILEQKRIVGEKNEELENLIEELKTTQQYLVQAEKMSSIGFFTTGLMHEINNSLNNINGGLYFLSTIKTKIKSEFTKSESLIIKNGLDMINEGYDRSIKIMNSLKTFSYKGKSEYINSDIIEIIENTLLFLKPKYDGNIKIIRNYTDEKFICVYPDKLHQVLINIIDNAIYIQKKNLTKNAKIVISTFSNNSNKYIIEISNNGPKIPLENLSSIFDPFFTTKDPGEGPGLGLSICYNLIKEHNGYIDVKNTKDGVCFTLKIPKKQNCHSEYSNKNV